MVIQGLLRRTPIEMRAIASRSAWSLMSSLRRAFEQTD